MQPRSFSERCTDSGPSTFLTDYLVIRGRVSARSTESARDTLSPLHSSKYIVAELLCRVQRSPKQATASLSANPDSERHGLKSTISREDGARWFSLDSH
jgi:hypothetical protein